MSQITWKYNSMKGYIMKRYIFKLNVQPNIISRHSTEELIQQLIPNKIHSAFNTIFNIVEDNNETLDFNLVNNYQEIIESREYSELMIETEVFVREYIQITKEYIDRNGLNYDQAFLDKSELLIEKRKNIFKLYPILTEANNYVDSKVATKLLEDEYGFEVESKVGIGIDHIRQIQKLIHLKLFGIQDINYYRK